MKRTLFYSLLAVALLWGCDSYPPTEPDVGAEDGVYKKLPQPLPPLLCITSSADILVVETPSGYKIIGTDGDDTIDCHNTSGTPLIINGGDGNDYIRGGWGHDQIAGGAGNDHLVGHKGNDKLLGGDGDDILDGRIENDICIGGAGWDNWMGCNAKKRSVEGEAYAPVANPDRYSGVLAGSQLTVTAPGLLNNDDLGGPSATLVSFGGGSWGGNVTDHAAGSTATACGYSLTVNADGSVSLGPSLAVGELTFHYRIQNSLGMYADGLVTITIVEPSG
ncbi:MAG: hypothetical protein M8861_10125 [marine benthic group bacterium]|nr:hypothetical protein [Gemmatimonadota bacterium]